jgi:hypothetical protein
MTWTYTGDPSANNRDEVRFLIGDTDNTDPIVQDEEIAYAVAQEANNRLAAIRIVRSLIGKYSRKVDKSVGDLKISYSQIAKNYTDLAKFLEESDDNLYAPIAYAGGISLSDKDTVRQDSDRTDPIFKKGMNDNPVNNTDNDEDWEG